MINSILLAIPVYNEAATLKSLFARIRQHYAGPILFVNDGSTDESENILKSCMDSNSQLVNENVNLGYGNALSICFSCALKEKYEYLITMDADLQHDPDDLILFFTNLTKADILSGSRYLMPRTSAQAWHPHDRKTINEKITKEIVQFTGYSITDAFCGFKCYSRKALHAFSLSEQGYGLPLQLWIQAAAHQLTVEEIPVKKIYYNHRRSFPEKVRDPEQRLLYYQNIIRKELAEWEQR